MCHVFFTIFLLQVLLYLSLGCLRIVTCSFLFLNCIFLNYFQDLFVLVLQLSLTLYCSTVPFGCFVWCCDSTFCCFHSCFLRSMSLEVNLMMPPITISWEMEKITVGRGIMPLTRRPAVEMRLVILHGTRHTAHLIVPGLSRHQTLVLHLHLIAETTVDNQQNVSVHALHRIPHAKTNEPSRLLEERALPLGTPDDSLAPGLDLHTVLDHDHLQVAGIESTKHHPPLPITLVVLVMILHTLHLNARNNFNLWPLCYPCPSCAPHENAYFVAWRFPEVCATHGLHPDIADFFFLAFAHCFRYLGEGA